MTGFSHLNASGEAVMVDVAEKAITSRTAVAEGYISLSPAAFAAVQTGDTPKGDVFAAARIAGIMAAKRTSDLIPLCHPLPISRVTIGFEFRPGTFQIRVEALVKVAGQTGVEMEALTAVSVACLTLYDMIKAMDKSMRIDGIRLLSKIGGKSGDYLASGGKSVGM